MEDKDLTTEGDSFSNCEVWHRIPHFHYCSAA